MTDSYYDAICPGCSTLGAKIDRTIYDYNIVICPSCGLAYAHPRPRPSEIEKFYDSLELSENFYSSNSPFKSAFFELCYESIEKYCTGGRLLDFGCGDCGFLNAEKKGRFELYGSDLNSAVEKMEHSNKIKFLIGPLREQGIPDEFFDVVFTSATYEHLIDPISLTKEIYRILRPGGIFFIVSVPNYRAFNVRLGLEDWLINRPPAHINFFTQKSLVNLVQSQGFAVKEQWTYGFNVDPIKRRFLKRNSTKDLKEFLGNAKHAARAKLNSRTKHVKDRMALLVAKAYFHVNYLGWGDKLALISEKCG